MEAQNTMSPVCYRELIPQMIAIAAPIALHHGIIFSLGFIDLIMIGQLGSAAIAGCSMANQIFFLLNLLLFGISSGMSVFTAQCWGRNDSDGIIRFSRIGVIFGFLSGLIFFTLGYTFSEKIISIYSPDQEVIINGGKYLKIVAFSYLTTAVLIPLTISLRSMRQVIIPVSISIVSLLINTVMNYILIFGKIGFPALGIEGAAIATSIARLLELILLVGAIFIYLKNNPLKIVLKSFPRISIHQVKSFVKIALPVVINELSWALGYTTYIAIFARISLDSAAAFSISETVMNLAMVVFFGSCSSCTVLIGNSIGSGNQQLTDKTARFFLIWAVVAGLILGIIIFSISSLVPLVFNVGAEVKQLASTVMMIFSGVLVFKIINFHVIVGIMRGAGDTAAGLCMDFVGMWLVGVPAAILTYRAGYGLPFVYLAANSEEIIKSGFAFLRYRSGKWRRKAI